MDAVVLVGGEGTRLRPLTYDTPKQMLPIVDRTLIEHVVAWLGRCGVDRAILSLGYKPDAFTDAFPKGEIDGTALVYAVEPEPLDTAGAIRFAAEAGGVSESFFVVNGDILTDFDASTLLEFHRERRAEASIYLTPVPDPSAFGLVVTDTDGRVSAFIEKPPPGTAPTNLINAGTYVLEPSVLDRIAADRRVSIERETFPAVAAAGGLYAMGSDAYWLDCGTHAKYIEAQLDIVGGKRRSAAMPLLPLRSAGVFVASDAIVNGALDGCAYVGHAVTVADDACVTDSVLLDGSSIGEGAAVERSIVMSGASIGPGSVVEDSIVGPGAVIGGQAKLTALTVVRGGCVVPEASVKEGEKIGAP
ncbi:MAG TPA: NDP-sugar synthase [Acidimicrobiales bacterium]|jgi:mannose-1-phosphate guanylyltransferase|nr:NDP-sugar synthase [Acidimicrobiales bacterium]